MRSSQQRSGAAALLAGLGLVGSGLVGCDAAPPQREVVVAFAYDATEAQVDAVRTTCDGIGGIRADPKPPEPKAIDRVYPVHYDTTGVSGAALRELYDCLGGQPAVRAFEEVNRRVRE